MKDLLEDEPPVLPFRGMVGLGLIGIAAIAIGYNALAGQSGRLHPAPLGEGWSNALRKDGGASTAGQNARARTAMPSSAVSKSPGNAAAIDQRVKTLQQHLAVLGHYRGAIDGQANEATRDAVIAYQEAKGLDATGKVSPQLMEMISTDALFMAASGLASATNAQPTQASLSAKAAPATSAERERMMLIQRGLAELGYRPGPADGIAGEQTRQAIRQFQRDRGLPETGVLDRRALEELGKVTGISSLHGV